MSVERQREVGTDRGGTEVVRRGRKGTSIVGQGPKKGKVRGRVSTFFPSNLPPQTAFPTAETTCLVLWIFPFVRELSGLQTLSVKSESSPPLGLYGSTARAPPLCHSLFSSGQKRPLG